MKLRGADEAETTQDHRVWKSLSHASYLGTGGHSLCEQEQGRS